jgi:drug/metabolite transporter (DMT)-like permease
MTDASSAYASAGGMSKRHDLVLWGSLIAISAMWGSAYLFIKLLVNDVPPFALAAMRTGVAALALALMFLSMRQRLNISRGQWLDMLVLGTTNGWLPNVLTALALLEIESAKAGMINASTPLFTMLLAHIWMRDEKLQATKVFWLIVGFAGIFLLIGPEAVLGATGSLVGHLLIVGVAVCYAVGTVYGRWRRPANPAHLALGQLVCASVPAALISLAIEPNWHIDWQPLTVFSVLTLGIFCSALPAVLYLNLLRRSQATDAAMVSYLVPVWAAALGVLVLGEPLTWSAVVGCAVVLLGVWSVNHVKTPAVEQER